MMTRLSKLVRFLPIFCWAALSAGPEASAQTQPELDLQLYAGVTIAGTVGTVYSVEYVPELDPTSDWRCLTFLQLATTNVLWFDSTASASGKRLYRAVEFDAPTNLVFIPPGAFRLGSPTNEVDSNILDPQVGEHPQTAVTISRGFWIGKYEVTQGEYLAVMGTNPSNFPSDTSRPVEQVTWFNATDYCNKLTQQERASGQILTNSLYRLPTEAEWEYACRGWTSTRFSYGDDPGYTDLTQYGWYDGNSDNTSHGVGQKLPNPWGLYDMHGNVLEWCLDWYATYRGGILVDPPGPATGSSRVFRGGDWSHADHGCRSAFRFGLAPSSSYYNLGFRLVLVPGQP